MAKKKNAVVWLKQISRDKRPTGTHVRVIADKKRQDEIDRAEDQMRDEKYDEKLARDYS